MATRSAIASQHAIGSAREGAHHWKLQRLTAIANVPLVIWFVFAAANLAGTDYAEVRAWLGSPLNTILMSLFVISTFLHARLGLQVIVEDYVHHKGTLVAVMVALNLGLVALATGALVAILKVSLGS